MDNLCVVITTIFSDGQQLGYHIEKKPSEYQHSWDIFLDK